MYEVVTIEYLMHEKFMSSLILQWYADLFVLQGLAPFN